MKRLKLTQSTHIGYTGQIGRYAFVDGISVEEIPLNERNRIGANFGCVEIEDDGAEGVDPSPAANVLAAQLRPALATSLKRQTEAEKTIENAKAVFGDAPKPLYTSAAIEAVAARHGIAGVRVLAAVWQVKSKSIPELIRLVEEAQSAYISGSVRELTAKGVPADEIQKLFEKAAVVDPALFGAAPVIEPVAAPVAEPVAAPVAEPVNVAAATGDLAAAISQAE